MKRKRPHSSYGKQRFNPPPFHLHHPGQAPSNQHMPGPSNNFSPGFIPLHGSPHLRHGSQHNGHRSPHHGYGSPTFRPKMRNNRQSHTSSPYHNNGTNNNQRHKNQGAKAQSSNASSNKSSTSEPSKNTKLKGNAPSSKTLPLNDHDKKVGVNNEEISQESKNTKITIKTDVIVIDGASSPEKDSSSKRRKVVIIQSDDEDTEHSSKPLEQQSSSKHSGKCIPPKYSLYLTTKLQRYHSDNQQNQAFFDRKVSLREGVQGIIRQNFGEGILHLTGSSMTGFGTLKSDADMALVFDPNVNTIPKKKSRNVISRLASCLRRQAFCSNVEMIFAKVPIVKFFDNISQCDVDININNIVGIKNSFLLKSISLVDERIPPLVIAVKAWAKSHDINSAYMGTLSSYLLVSMIIYFLQTGVSPPILPPLKQYVDSLQSVNVNSQLQHLVPKKFIKFDVRNKEALGEIFARFFQFWVKKLRQNKVFSVYSAEEKIRTYNTPFLDTSSYVLVVEEPFLKDNIARAVRAQHFDTVKEKFQETCNMMTEITDFEDLFGNST